MWEDRAGELYRKFKFKDFKQAFGFMQKVAAAAEKMNHHPRWQNEYNMVEVWLSTHSEGKITDKDSQLAKEIDKIYEDS
jgi:4a-hydroxytetrahydrobiopterin dehydratase